MLDSLCSLHKKYLATEFAFQVSRTTFCRFRPFWVVAPKQSDRETCACSKHSNVEMICASLYNAKTIPTKKPDELLKAMVCDEKDIDCMLRNCPRCKERTIPVKSEVNENLNKIITYAVWESKAEKREIKGEFKDVRKTVKIQKNDIVKNILNILQVQFTPYMKHVFFMRHQQKELQRLKQFLQPNELLLQIDFSENYIAKYESEIQSMHFGASKKQISLHTGVYYYRTESDALVKSQSFCSVSDNLDHQSHAIWAHLHTILLELANRFPNITQVHFLSDGPTSQYKNRNNCFLMCKKIPQYFTNIKSMSWNYSESGHGKGPMDGVGGSLKRKADRLVLQGQDIICAGDFVHKLKESSVKIWEVLEEEIKDAKLEIPNNISQVPNIMSMHQVTWSKKFADKLFLRKLSCFACKFDEPCIHYSLKPSVVLIAAKTKSILFIKY
ncbi:unnamed protein product [Diabrotica balteata]|uniref:Uncharacterized protein n=1 Tax=Diabrotica balteata TaxID=107213 RepID=A0A9P0GWL7_DIABA|nr:unnamed protein product [Diabrotica balteata]